MRSVIAGTVLALVATPLATAAPVSAQLAHTDRSARASHPAQAVQAQAARAPGLRVKKLVTGLDHPWDVKPIGKGRLLYTQRDRATVSLWANGRQRTIKDFPSSSVWVSGETGLMGLEVASDFGRSRTFWTCQGGTTSGGGHDVRVMRWTLDQKLRRVVSQRELLGGFPTSSGRHGGCRLLQVGHRLYVGTGDAAVGSNPESLTSLGGKTLCLQQSGRPCPSNPFAHAGNRKKRYIHTYGHRNVQGLTQRADGSLWSIEQGTYRDDEVNLLRNGGDYGYNPVPGYNESVPMTDQSLPGKQIAAAWRSGDPTVATSGGGFIYGKGLGAYDGTLAVAALKDERVLFLTFSQAGKLQTVRIPAALKRFGRIRTVVDGPGSVFYVTTDNGGGNDAILAVRPRG